ncbi:MAG: hypothetical protein HY830_14015 [Actinobacteria bacterium]|nr:hypothetical protein [Actinomycetota bacterium]
MSETTETPELIDADVLSKSITGFEQIDIRQTFRERLDSLANDGTMFMRALLFVLEKRGGMHSGDAYRNVMLLPLEDVVARFKGDDEPDEDDEDAVAERDRQYADFVTACRLSFTVEQYMQLTIGQRAALLDAADRLRG